MPETTTRLKRLLDELVALLLAEGFAGFTLADLAERLHCSKTTLYALGHSKEQLTVNAVNHFFRTATEAVEAATAGHADPATRIVTYLEAVAAALRPASVTFMADIAAHPATRAVYERNTRAAARRVSELIGEGTDQGSFRPVHGAFVADTVATAMSRIQTGHVLVATGMHDSDAYHELALLILNGIRC